MSKKKEETLREAVRLELWYQCDRFKCFLMEHGRDIGYRWRGLAMAFNDRAIDARIFCENIYSDLIDNGFAGALKNLFSKKSEPRCLTEPIELSPDVTLIPPPRKQEP